VTSKPVSFLERAKEALMRILRTREMPVATAFVVLVAVTAFVNPRFLAPQSVKDLMLNATIIAILAAGQSIVIISRNVDLSVGSMLGISGFAVGTLFATFPEIPIPLVFVSGILIGALLGAVNGFLVAIIKVPSLVITLGTLYVFRGINNAWAGGKEYFSGQRPKEFGDLSVETIYGLPIITIMALVVILSMGIYLSRARSGRDYYAIGSDPAAAELFGIPVAKRVFFAFVLSGALAGLAGVLWASRFSSVGARTGLGVELDVVAAVVVGGVAIFGGSGTVIGASIGALLLTTITSSLTAVQVDKFWQQAVVGVLIISAIVIDRVSSLRAARKRKGERSNV
jgi:rhamnose transport system permease protein